MEKAFDSSLEDNSGVVHDGSDANLSKSSRMENLDFSATSEIPAGKTMPNSSNRPNRFIGRKSKVASSSGDQHAGDEAQSSSTKDKSLAARLAIARQRKGKTIKRASLMNQIPDDILNDPELKAAMAHLPSNYDFQIAKTVWRLKQANAKKVALQLPEGLLMFACILSDIFEQIAGVEEALVMADVTYGACCIDDYGARALGCDFMVHYGHSCLVPIDVTSRGCENEDGNSLKLLYVFVDIKIDVEHFVECVKLTFPMNTTRLYVMGTIQFASSLHHAKELLEKYYSNVEVPQAKPLSKGEVLGCTSPSLEYGEHDALLFIADGRFHLESAMIANPHLAAYRYNPYDKILSKESYDSVKMRGIRKGVIDQARRATRWGIIMGTLGRQGNPAIVKRLEALLHKNKREYFVLLLSETFPSKLKLMDEKVDAWVQVACPRLSIDWGTSFSKPLLSPYEAYVAFGETDWKDIYPQDFYAKGSGPWTNYYDESKTT